MASRNPKYDSDYIRAVNQTYRARGATSGASGARAVVPRVVESLISPRDRVLDFGAGTEAIHARNLRLKGYNVFAYDIGMNLDPAIHDRTALTKKWDVVYASNVMNVQPSKSALVDLLSVISQILVKGGLFVGNYPSSPRKSGLSVSDVDMLLNKQFSAVERVKGVSSPTWVCKR
jgi:hypothetical protein